MPAEARVRAMGSTVHVIVVGGPAGLVARSVALIDALEARWSRFLPDSEVTRLNESAGMALPVSADTLLLVDRAVQAWQMTDGAFDPTVLGDVVRAGYDRSFDALGPFPRSSSVLGRDCGAIVVDHRAGTVRLPHGVGFDPGGIGKGLAGDLVVAELLAAGATGVCVNLGGDVRVAGQPPAGDAWQVAVRDEVHGRVAALVAVRDGAVATSSTRRRRWMTPAGPAHHVIDPFRGVPSTTGVAAATVVAAIGWRAEALSTAALAVERLAALAMTARLGAEAFLVDDDGASHTSPGLVPYLQAA